MRVLSNSYDLYLYLLSDSKVYLACEKILVKQWHG